MIIFHHLSIFIFLGGGFQAPGVSLYPLFRLSNAYGTPREGSDYDVFVILKDDTEKPILVLQNIYRGLAQNPNYKAVDVLANYKSRFEVRSKLPTIEKTIAQKGIVLYDHA